jgi:hypothetical protein
MRTWVAGAAALALGSIVAGCDDTMINVSSDGQIDVAVSTSGFTDNVDGFTISVDGGTEQFVQLGSGLTLRGLALGRHTVQLNGLTENCHVEGSNPRTITVNADGQAPLTFIVDCALPTTGGFKIEVTTTGPSPDPNGYAVTVSNSDTRHVDINGTVTYTGLESGRHLITFKDLDPPCALTVGNPLLSTVVPGKTVTVRIQVACGTT